MNCKGLHCPGCRHGGGGPAALVALVVVIVTAAAAARKVVHAAAEVLEVVAIAGVSLAALAIAGGTAYAALRLYRWRAETRQAITQHAPRQLGGSQGAAEPRAIEAPGFREIVAANAADPAAFLDELTAPGPDGPRLYVIRPVHRPAGDD